MKPTYIYTLSDPDTKEVRYVGKSVNPKRRYYVHTCIQTGLDTHCKRWIGKLKSENKKPIMEIIEEIITDNWQDREIYWISYFRKVNTNLTNMTVGGDGVPCIPIEIELDRRIKVSEARKGMHFSEEHKLHLSEKKKEYFSNPKNKEVLSRHWSVLNDNQVLEIYELANRGKISQRQISRMFGIPQSSVSEIKYKKRYVHAFSGEIGG